MKPLPISLITPPACRIGGLAWIPNHRGEVLTVCANYGERAGFHILPGGHAAEHQSNLAAMVTHVQHETGISPTPVRLLGTDWVPRNTVKPVAMGQNFVYLCAGVHANKKIVLPSAAEDEEPELSGYLWQTAATAEETMRPYQLRRFLGLWKAWQNGAVAVMHEGRPVLSTQRARTP
ncbi:NUDIX domain-containing protein [Streptomyces sp. NPDC056308]|uniref:NUDIX domain-containing protein n=1 Tax=Streptomyces sp. NPDC056308 TaxID=3345780 RepID=UPI0035D8AD04